jgi:hypothetical protein
MALWPAGIIEIVNVARTIWKVEDPCPMLNYVHMNSVLSQVDLRFLFWTFFLSSSTVGPVGFPTVGTAAYRLIVPPCVGSHLSPLGALRAQIAQETSSRERENYGREMAE